MIGCMNNAKTMNIVTKSIRYSLSIQCKTSARGGE